MNKIICPRCSSEDVKDISTLSSNEIKVFEDKLQKKIVKEEILYSKENEQETNIKIFILFIYFGVLIALITRQLLLFYDQKIGCSCLGIILFVFVIPHLVLKIKFTKKKYKEKYICSYCENIFEIDSETNEINKPCAKCDSDTIYKVSTLIDNKNKNEEDEYWNSDYIDEKAKSKMLFFESLYKKKLDDIAKSSFFYIYIAFLLPIIIYVPFGIIQLFDIYNTVHFSLASIIPPIYYEFFKPHIILDFGFMNMGKFSFFDFFYVLIFTIIAYYVIFLDYYIYLIRKKKFDSYCFCPNCQTIFIPTRYKVILKKNTSIFTKLYLAHKKLTRQKFVNVRYVSDKIKNERKKWF